MAVAVRRRLRIPPHKPLPARQLAAKLGIRILDVGELPRSARTAPSGKGCALSAATALGTNAVIVYDASQPPVRQESRLLRELARALLEHEPVGVVERCGILFGRFDAEQEAEAAYLGGCLQIPREGLLWSLGRRMSTSETALHFGASEQMVRYRRNVTGVDRQLASSARRRVRDG